MSNTHASPPTILASSNEAHKLSSDELTCCTTAETTTRSTSSLSGTSSSFSSSSSGAKLPTLSWFLERFGRDQDKLQTFTEEIKDNRSNLSAVEQHWLVWCHLVSISQTQNQNPSRQWPSYKDVMADVHGSDYESTLTCPFDVRLMNPSSTSALTSAERLAEAAGPDVSTAYVQDLLRLSTTTLSTHSNSSATNEENSTENVTAKTPLSSSSSSSFKKTLCPHGAVCCATIHLFPQPPTNKNKNKLYTGLLQPGQTLQNVILRLSSAIQPPCLEVTSRMGKLALHGVGGKLKQAQLFPTVSVKVFRDGGVASGNLLFGGCKTGQPEKNFFAHCLCTQLTERVSRPLKPLIRTFWEYSDHPLSLGVSDFCRYGPDGRSSNAGGAVHIEGTKEADDTTNNHKANKAKEEECSGIGNVGVVDQDRDGGVVKDGNVANVVPETNEASPSSPASATEEEQAPQTQQTTSPSTNETCNSDSCTTSDETHFPYVLILRPVASLEQPTTSKPESDANGDKGSKPPATKNAGGSFGKRLLGGLMGGGGASQDATQPTTSSTNNNPPQSFDTFLDQLLSIPPNTHLYDLFACPTPLDASDPSKLERIGCITSTSEFVPSGPHDGLFFRHQRKEQDYALRPNWKEEASTAKVKVKDGILGSVAEGTIASLAGWELFESHIRLGRYVDYESGAKDGP